MRKRDLAILMLSAFAIFFSLQVFFFLILISLFNASLILPKNSTDLQEPQLLKYWSITFPKNSYFKLVFIGYVYNYQHEGDLSFKEAWFHLSEEYPIKYEAERLPPPIVSDLNGDGKKEVLVATHDAKIQVISLITIPQDQRLDIGFIVSEFQMCIYRRLGLTNKT